MRAWEPQPGETKKAWDAFKIYRDMGSERTLKKTSEVYYGSTASVRRIAVWSSKYEWVDRCQAFDAWKEMIENDAIEQHVRAKATEFAERQSALRESMISYSEKAAEQINQMLDAPLYREKVDEDGETKILIPAKWSKTTIAHLHQLVAQAVEPTEKAEGTSPEFEKIVEMLSGR